jgi:hypothetical protein
MTTSYDHEALWTKAKLFLNRAMDEHDSRTFDERALWASFALELLAKAALARVSPLLVAEPSEDGSNLLIASGLVKGDARFTSVRAKTLYSRCHKAFKPFSLSEAMAITNARNEYLHAAGVGYTAIPERVWWPRFWAQAAVLVTALDQEMQALVGPSRDAVVTQFLEQNAKNVEHRTETLIERARQRLAQYQDGTLAAKVAAEFHPGSDRSAGLPHSERETCPSCGAYGLLEGDTVSDTDVEWEQISEEDFEPTVRLTVEADYFSCANCQLVLNGYELLDQAGLSTTFYAEGSIDDVYEEPDYGND